MNQQIEIIPSILVKSFKEFTDKVRLVQDYTKWIQLDVSDGDFAPNKTWGNPLELHYYDPGVFIEVHLMVSSPEKVIDDWLTGRSEEKDSGVRRIFFHYEATAAHEEIIKKIKDAGIEVGIALLPETSLSTIKPIDELVDAVLFFSGNLGYYGGNFNEKVTIDKISTFSQMHPYIIIEVDGGMNPKTAKKVVEAGASAIVSGSYIWDSDNPQKAIDELRSAIQP